MSHPVLFFALLPLNLLHLWASLWFRAAELTMPEVTFQHDLANVVGDGPGQIPLGATITSAALILKVSSQPPLNPDGDTFFGKSARDTFVIPNPNGRDWIYDFGDDDLIDLRAYRFGSLKEIGMRAEGNDLVLDFSNSWTPINDRPQQLAGGFPGGPPASLVTPSSNFSDASIQASPSGTIHRFGARYGERRSNDSVSGDRTELKHQTDYAPRTDVWISYNLLVEKQKPGEPDYTWTGVLGASQTHLGQFHGGAGSPIITFQLVDNDSIEMWTRPHLPNRTSDNTSHIVRYRKDDFERGREYNVVMHIKTAPDGVGSIFEMWLDGVQILDLHDIPLGYTNSNENNYQWGVYRRTNEIPLAVQFANVEVGTVNLSHRIANPLPVNFGTPAFAGINMLTLKGYLATHAISDIFDNLLL